MTHVEIGINAELVRDQHPDLADRPVQLGARGWDNHPPAWQRPYSAAACNATRASRY